MNISLERVEMFIKEAIKVKPGLLYDSGTSTLFHECQSDTGIELISTTASQV